MDRRETGPKESAYQRDLRLQQEANTGEYEIKVVEDGKEYRIPYRMVKQVEFSNLSRQELIDQEHAARLQYRLLLNDAVLRAKVEFAKLKITIIYNPSDAKNTKEKISIEGIIDFLAGEGVQVDQRSMVVTDFDYYNDIYRYQFNPASIREHPPYTYTMEEWKKMKPAFEEKARKGEEEKVAKFHEWQNEYAEQNPDMGLEKVPVPVRKVSVLGRIFGGSGKKKAKKDEKGFWFHGV